MSAIAPFRNWCRARGWSTSAVAVAWTLHQGDHVLPIPGTRSAVHIRDLAQAAEIALTPDDLSDIARLLPPGFAQGARYADAQWPGVEQYC
jgi:aryl-alcohol dehydrogenase-like predicted oxidoreductase